jgi:serine/threonine-protein kinase RsbW
VIALEMCRPPAIEVGWWTLEVITQLRDLRGALHRMLAGRAGGADVAAKVTLVATELAGNALLHGRAPVEVRLLNGDGRWLIQVTDSDLANAPTVAGPGQATAGGRGLRIARALSTDIGWYIAGQAKHVWAAVPTASTQDAPPDRTP